MPRSLLIAVRFHEGRYHGQADGFSGADGWPPSPARLFQALVAAAARGARLPAEDERALKWLEGIDPPRIAAPVVRRGRTVKRFVPNNDLDSVGGDPNRVSEIRVGKHWRPCFFEPSDPVLYVWDFESGWEEAARIRTIAPRLYQLGRGIDPAWASGEILDREEATARLESHPGPLRRPRGHGDTPIPGPGSLESLIDRYRRKRTRLTTVGTGRKSGQLFTQPPKAFFARTGYDTPPRRLHFELREADGAFAPRPLASAAPLITGLRNAAAEKLRESSPERSALFERLIIGRNAGPADLSQRIRLIPIPSIGAQHTDPSIRRILVEIPPNCPIRPDDLAWAFAGVRPCDPTTGELWPGSLVSTDDSQMADRFVRTGLVFRSITPLALSGAQRRRIGAGGEKAAKERSREERSAASAVVQALRHAGIQARPAEIQVRREPFQTRGARAELFAQGSRFSKHGLWHVELRFTEAIPGPLVIGDGRFCGLGLMEPVRHRTGVFAFSLSERNRIAPEDGFVLIRHLRRALMALARDSTGGVDRLFSGHESDGRPDRSGRHGHVFLAADSGPDGDGGSIGRFIVAAPWAVDPSTKPQRGERHRFEEVTRRLTDLRAGSLGRFDHLSAEPLADTDPLLASAKTWATVTPYVATRNLKKRDDPTEMVKADVAAECNRRGRPTPTGIQILEVSVGPRGGRPTARLKLHFAVAVRGPLILGRDSHTGGGLFQGALS